MLYALLVPTIFARVERSAIWSPYWSRSRSRSGTTLLQPSAPVAARKASFRHCSSSSSTVSTWPATSSIFLYSHSLGSSAPVRGCPRQFRKRAQYRAGWMIWLAGLKTMGQKSGRSSSAGSFLPPLRTTKRGSSSVFTQASSRLMVVTPMDVLVPMTSLSCPTCTTLHSQGMFLRAKKRTPEPKVRCASMCTRPWAKMVPTTVRRGST
mmetsp:Transcript_107791/g.286958  ORF Transcript_107791/g.286958 Transcript_107791/m.286958 type:complete len:208 (+) Transcript_107791:102-725(+)